MSIRPLCVCIEHTLRALSSLKTFPLKLTAIRPGIARMRYRKLQKCLPLPASFLRPCLSMEDS